MRSLQEIYLHILGDKMPSLHLWCDLTAINTKNCYMWQYSAKFCPTIQVILPFATLWQYYLAGSQSSPHHTNHIKPLFDHDRASALPYQVSRVYLGAQR